MTLTLNDKLVEVEVDASGAACDAYFASGYYVDTGKELSDNELHQLTDECRDELAEYCLEKHGYWRE